MEYCILKEGEIIKEGDQCVRGRDFWQPVKHSIGRKVSDFSFDIKFRRPVSTK